MKRRGYLASCGVVGTAGLAGCLGGVLSGTATTRLARLGVSNEDEARGHRFDLRVERDGEVVHESSRTVERDQYDDRVPGAAVDCTWDAVEGRYVVFARIDGGEWVEKGLAEDYEGGSVPDCVIAVVVAGRSRPAVEVYDWCDQFVDGDGGCPAEDTPTPAANRASAPTSGSE